MGAEERPVEPRLLPRMLVWQSALRKTSLEVFWWAPERMLLLGALRHPHRPWVCTPQLWEGVTFPSCFSRGRQAGVLLLSRFTDFPLSSTAKPRSVGEQLFGLQSQPANSSGISGLRSSVLLQFTPHLPFSLSPLHKQVP